MENRRVLSRIFELQTSAASSSNLKQCNDQYTRTISDLEKEVKKLRTCLKEVETEKNTFEKDLAIYITENKSLNQRLLELRESHDCNASTSAKLLREVTCQNTKLMSIQSELEDNLDRKRKEITSNNADWSKKVATLEKANLQQQTEMNMFEKHIEELKRELAHSKESFSANLLKKDMESQDINEKLEITRKQTKMEESRQKKEIIRLKSLLDEKEKIAGLQLETTETKLKALQSEVDDVRHRYNAEVARNEELASQMLNEKSNLMKRLTLTTEQREEAREKVRKVETKSQKIQRELDTFANEITHLQLLLKEKEECQSLQSNVSESKQRSLQSELDEIRLRYNAETLKNKELAVQIHQLNISVKECNEILFHAKETHASELTRLNDQIKALKLEVKDKSSEINVNSDLMNRLALATKQNEATCKKVVRVEAENQKLQEKVNASVNEILQLQSIVKEKETCLSLQLKMNNTQQRDHQSEVDDIQHHYNKQVEKNDELTAQILRLNGSVEEYAEKLARSKETHERELSCLNDQMQLLQLEVKEKSSQVAKNSDLGKMLTLEMQKREEASDKLSEIKTEHRKIQRENDALAKVNETMKMTCAMQDEQIVDLEELNEQLRNHIEELFSEKEMALGKIRAVEQKLTEYERIVTTEKRLRMESKENSTDEIIQLQVKAREEANKVQDLQEQLENFERKYKLQELHSAMLQKKLCNEKSNCEHLQAETESYTSHITMLESVQNRATSKLQIELRKLDVLAHEKTALLNKMDDMKMQHSHEAIRFNSTIGQQSKLIDFLQAKIERLEPQDKKKRRKNADDLYHVPLQYRELQDMLEEAKQVNLQLQEKVNSLRTELQNSLSEINELKHGTRRVERTPQDPSSRKWALTRSPIFASPVSRHSEAPASDGIPHRLIKNLCTRTSICNVCLDVVRFGHYSLQCAECQCWCHVKCKYDFTDRCRSPKCFGLHKRHFEKKPVKFTSLSCVSPHKNKENVTGWLKVLCDGQSYSKKWIILRDGVLMICSNEKTVSNSSKMTKMDDSDKDCESLDLLKLGCYVHAAVPTSQFTITTEEDHRCAFKLELSPGNSYVPSRNIYFLSPCLTTKRKWVIALQRLASYGSSLPQAVSNKKVAGNKIVTLDITDNLEVNCTLPISQQKVLFGCEEGLFALSPSSSFVCGRSHIKAVEGVGKILQMQFLIAPHAVVAIEGLKGRIITFDISNLISQSHQSTDFVKVHPVEDLTNCHLFAVGLIEGAPCICAATISNVKICRFNKEIGKFEKLKTISTAEPCTCLQFTKCSIIMGTEKFLEIELKNYKVDEFLNHGNQSAQFEAGAFPLAILETGQADGIQEYLLCYHEFGVFVNCFGKSTGKDKIIWSRSPVSFVFKPPHLIIAHHSSVEIMFIHPLQQNRKNHQVYLDLPNPKYLGDAITSGAIYISSNDGETVNVLCCKGG